MYYIILCLQDACVARALHGMFASAGTVQPPRIMVAGLAKRTERVYCVKMVA